MRFPNLRIHLILAPSYLPSHAAISASAKILHKTKKRPRPPRAAREGARCRLTAPTRGARGGHAEGAPRAAAWATASVGGQASRRHGDTARVSAGANAASGSAGHRMRRAEAMSPRRRPRPILLGCRAPTDMSSARHLPHTPVPPRTIIALLGQPAFVIIPEARRSRSHGQCGPEVSIFPSRPSERCSCHRTTRCPVGDTWRGHPTPHPHPAVLPCLASPRRPENNMFPRVPCHPEPM